MNNTAQKEAMDRAGELPLERRKAERRALASHPAAPVEPAWGKCIWCDALSTTRDRSCSAPDGDGHQFKRTEPAAPPVQQTGDVRDLHAEIMNLPCALNNYAYTPPEIAAFQRGHRAARHAAAELASATLATTRPSAALTREQIGEVAQGIYGTAATEQEHAFARAILAASGGAHAVPGWISVTDRLPEHQQSAAFVVDAVDWARFQHLHGRVYGGTFNELDGCFNVPGVGFIASHWMPLPAAPTQDQGEGNA